MSTIKTDLNPTIADRVPFRSRAALPRSDVQAAIEYLLEQLTIGGEVQAWDQALDDISALAVTDGNIIVGNGTNWVAESGATARASLGLTIGTDVQAYSAVLAATTASFLTADETKLDQITVTQAVDLDAIEAKLAYITITQAVDLDAIETRVNALDAAVVLKGGWDASAGTFPGGGVAESGWSYIVTVAGTVDGVAFSINDRLLAYLDNASTTTYAANWLKLDYTDQVVSVAGRTGAVTIASTDLTDSTANGRAILTAANYAAMKALLDLEIGTDVQAYSARLVDIAALTATDGNVIVGNGSTWVAESGATARTSLGLAIGTDVQAYDADTLKADVADVLTAGFAATPYSAGTKSSGTYTPDEANGNLQYATNGGAHTLAPPTNNCTMVIQYTNNGSAGAITTSGFTKVSGDSFATTNGNDYMCYIVKLNGFSHLHVTALQ